jgi:hypothetical protein
MNTTLSPPVQPTRMKQSQPADLPQQTPEFAPAKLRMHIQPDVARELDRYITVIVKKFRRAFDNLHETGGTERRVELILDLSDVTEVPHSSLVFLVSLLRRTLGKNIGITLFGLSPMIQVPLTAFDLPRSVVVIDSRNRKWAA